MKNCTNNCEVNQDPGVLSEPLSFLRSGLFFWGGASLHTRGGDGYYWSLRSADTTNSNRLRFYNTYLDPQYSNFRGYGFAVRCVSILFSKSFTTLINTSYSMKNGESEHGDSGVLSNPLSFSRNGRFSWNGASLDIHNGYGFCWSLRSGSTTTSGSLSFDNTYLNPQYGYTQGFGFAVRCFSFYAF